MKRTAKKNAKSVKSAQFNMDLFMEEEYVFDLAKLKKQVVDKGYISIEIL
jgi:hypothetical protein